MSLYSTGNSVHVTLHLRFGTGHALNDALQERAMRSACKSIGQQTAT